MHYAEQLLHATLHKGKRFSHIAPRSGFYLAAMAITMLVCIYTYAAIDVQQFVLSLQEMTEEDLVSNFSSFIPIFNEIMEGKVRLITCL